MSLGLRRSLFCVLVCCALLAGKRAMAQAALPSLSDPAISPDGREIAFVSGGDIWTVAAGGGEAHLLVTHPARVEDTGPSRADDGDASSACGCGGCPAAG
jgi:tricorn protease